MSEFKQSKKPSMTMREVREATGYTSRSKTLCFARHLAETYPSFEFRGGKKRTQAAKLIYLPNVPADLKKGVR